MTFNVNPDWLTLFAVLGAIVIYERRMTKLESVVRRIAAHLFPNEPVDLGGG